MHAVSFKSRFLKKDAYMLLWFRSPAGMFSNDTRTMPRVRLPFTCSPRVLLIPAARHARQATRPLLVLFLAALALQPIAALPKQLLLLTRYGYPALNRTEALCSRAQCSPARPVGSLQLACLAVPPVPPVGPAPTNRQWTAISLPVPWELTRSASKRLVP